MTDFKTGEGSEGSHLSTSAGIATFPVRKAERWRSLVPQPYGKGNDLWR